jgi:hypothetical protein
MCAVMSPCELYLTPEDNRGLKGSYGNRLL